MTQRTPPQAGAKKLLHSTLAKLLCVVSLLTPFTVSASATDACEDAQRVAVAAFSQHAEVPRLLAATHVRQIYVACYGPDVFMKTPELDMAPTPSIVIEEIEVPPIPPPVPLVLGTLLPLIPTVDVPIDAPQAKVCAGGGSSIIGWREEIAIGTFYFHLQNVPASGEYHLTYLPNEEGNGGTVISGHGETDTLLDTFTWEKTSYGEVGAWTWLFLPMGGSASIRFNCFDVPLVEADLLTSARINLEGTPLGIGGPVRILSYGSTCALPC